MPEAKRSKPTPMQLVKKRPERRAPAPARHPARRATDFPHDSTAIRAKNRPGDAAILERTGKSWREWFQLLNAPGVRREQRKKLIAANTNASFSWRNIVLLVYELDWGVREQFARPEGYNIAVSRTVAVAAEKLFDYWSQNELRQRWLDAKNISIGEQASNKSVQITWDDGTTWLHVDFHALDGIKTRMVVHHHQLPQRRVAEMKLFWTKALKKLKAVAEAG